jgi:hypothetical protein
MYAQQNKRNVTYIDDLPDLEDLESNQQDPNGGVPQQFQKFIRQPMGTPPEGSGMAPYNHTHQQEFLPLQQREPPVRPPVGSPTCLEIHDHIQQCPICSRFFGNDHTVYIIAIVILCILCILLLKRVLDL